MASKKNENRQTEVKFMFWSSEDNDNGKPYEKTEKICYTRSEAIALKELTKKYPNAMIQVKEVKPDELVKIVYNSQLVFENAETAHETEESANESATENYTIIPFTMYAYEGQYWAVSDGGEYETDSIYDESPVKFGKIDTRGFLRMSAEQLTGMHVLAIHNDTRIELKRWAVVPNERVEMCVKES